MANIDARVQEQDRSGSGSTNARVQHKRGKGSASKMAPQPRGAQHRDREPGVARAPKPHEAYGKQTQY